MDENEIKNQPSYLPRTYGGGVSKSQEISNSEDSIEQNNMIELEEDNDIDVIQGGSEPDDSDISEDMIPCTICKEVADDSSFEPAKIQPRSRKRLSRIEVNVVGVRFEYAGKIYNFDAGDMELKAGDSVVVKTEKGLGLAHVAIPPYEKELDETQFDGLRKILRKAGKVDFDQSGRCLEKETEAYEYCLERIGALELPMKLVGVECYFDRSKYVFFFTADGRVDFRELVKQLVARFPVRIEMRQIGVRHEAKMIGGLACCGQELCCSRFLTEFRPVSVKMAKRQNLSLNPSKISGGCGRLMCCLGYEHDIYEGFKEGLPKLGKVVQTTKGDGLLIKHNPLTETVTIQTQEGKIIDVRKEDVMGECQPFHQNDKDNNKSKE
jgi:cell fate regulator YaaT (PSP1 superfamily)